MDFELSAEHATLAARARAFADRLRPTITTLDDESRLPREHVGELAAQGLLTPHWPAEAVSGAPAAPRDTLAYALVLEELARVSPAHAILVSVHASLVGVPLLTFGTTEQKARWLPAMAKGDTLAAFALTEREAGSDAGALQTGARREGDGYVLNGEKVMITNAGPAGLFLVFATIDPRAGARGVTAFLVPGDAAGITRGPRDRTMGLRPADVRALHFENVRVPEGARLGDEGHGIKVALAALNVGRIGVAAQSVGIAAETLDRAVAYARGRRQFGQEIARFGGVGELLADMAIDRDVARLLTWEAAMARDRGEDFAHHAARAKWAASESACANADRCIQIHGGWGYDVSVGVERYARDARVTRLYEGTSEMQKLLVTRHAVTAAG
jgi:alkylation response protein AidB-like acyl-CoA dehydrogenase